MSGAAGQRLGVEMSVLFAQGPLWWTGLQTGGKSWRRFQLAALGFLSGLLMPPGQAAFLGLLHLSVCLTSDSSTFSAETFRSLGCCVVV